MYAVPKIRQKSRDFFKSRLGSFLKETLLDKNQFNCKIYSGLLTKTYLLDFSSENHCAMKLFTFFLVHVILIDVSLLLVKQLPHKLTLSAHLFGHRPLRFLYVHSIY